MKLGRHEWDEQVINACMYHHDASEVLKIQLSECGEDDILAWHHERSGVFSVWGAYKIALEEDQAEKH
jgi:hypothetical protein